MGKLTFRRACLPSELAVTHTRQSEVWCDLYSTSVQSQPGRLTVFSAPHLLSFSVCGHVLTNGATRNPPDLTADVTGWLDEARTKLSSSLLMSCFHLDFSQCLEELQWAENSFQHGWHFTGSQGPFTFMTQIRLFGWHTLFLSSFEGRDGRTSGSRQTFRHLKDLSPGCANTWCSWRVVDRLVSAQRASV